MALQKIKLHYAGTESCVTIEDDGINELYRVIEEEPFFDPCSAELDFLIETKEDCIELIKIANKLMSELGND